MIHAFKKFRFEIPAELYRLAVVGILASLLTIAMIYSRDGGVAREVTLQGSKQSFIQPKDRIQAEGIFIPTPKAPEASEDRGLEIANALPPPRSRPITP